MKTILSFFTICILAFTVNAQVELENNETESHTDSKNNRMTFFSGGKASHGIYLGLGGGYANLSDNDFLSLDARIAYVYNNAFEIGIAVNAFQDHNHFNSSSEVIDIVSGTLAGIHMKGILFGKKKIHLGAPVFFGGGALGRFASEGGIFTEDFDPENEEWSGLIVMDAGLNLEFNISKVLGFEIGGKYRIGTRTEIYENKFLNGLLLSAALKVGYFDFRSKSKKKKKEPRFDSDYIEY